MIHIFPVRHLSPRAAHELLAFCDARRPDCVLIEAPSDAENILTALSQPDVIPPVAVLAYTDETLTRSYTLPLAEYSPEYAALRWAAERGAAFGCVDLPFAVSLALPVPPETERENPYELCARAAGEMDFDTYFEAHFEHSNDYRAAAAAFGEALRAQSPPDRHTQLRERYMRSRVRAAEAKGYANLVVVCGAYHAPVLADADILSETDIAGLPRVECALTLIPHSYAKLSVQSGYGAGNASPKYHELLWTHRRDLSEVPAAFLSGVSACLGGSAVAVADAVVLAHTLGSLRGGPATLADLRSAAVTVLGQGDPEAVADALKAMEIGEKTGHLPRGVWRAPLQDDFHRALRDLKLTRYLQPEAAELALDLRGVSGDATPDRRRSAFLRRLRVIGVPFGQPAAQEGRSARGGRSTRGGRSAWKETWMLRYTPETEIALAERPPRPEASGITVEAAASAALTDALAKAGSVAAVAEIVGQALQCDLPPLFEAACNALLDGLAGRKSGDFNDAARAAAALDRVLQTEPEDSVRREALWPLLRRLCLRACLSLPARACCSDAEAGSLLVHIQTVQRVFDIYVERLDVARWQGAVDRVADNPEAHPRPAGLAFALRLERGAETTISLEFHRRLSRSAEHAAAWLDGLASRNRRALLSAPGLWEALDDTLAGLDEPRFRAALVPLRRLFARFTAEEKRAISARLAAYWGTDGHEKDVSPTDANLTEEEAEMLEELRRLEIN